MNDSNSSFAAGVLRFFGGRSKNLHGASPQPAKNYFVPQLLLFSSIIFIARVILVYLFPYTLGDGPWFAGHSFSILRGHFFENPFAYSYMHTFSLPYMFSLIESLFLFILNSKTHIYDLFIIHFIFLLIYMVITYRYMQKKNVQTAVALGFIIFLTANIYTFYLRPELFNSILLAFCLLLTVNNKRTIRYKIIGTGLLISVAGLSNPMGGIFGFFFIGYVLYNELKINFKQALLFLFIIMASTAVLYLPLMLVDFTEWKLNFFTRGVENEQHKMDLLGVYAFWYFSWPFLSGYIVLMAALKKWKELLLFAFFVLLIQYFGRIYYNYYLFLFILYSTSAHASSVNNILFIRKGIVLYTIFLLLLAAPYKAVYRPMYQIMNNLAFAKKYREILNVTYHYKDSMNNNHHIWIPTELGMPLIEYTNSRLYHPHMVKILQEKLTIDKGDIVLVTNKSALDTLQKVFNLDLSKTKITYPVSFVRACEKTR